MNALADPFKQLIERRLWPIALLLVAALAAVPMLLAKEPEETVLPSPIADVAPGQGATEPIVSLDDPARRDGVRAVLGSRKDPFRPAQTNPVPKVEDSLGSASVQTSTVTGASASGDVSSSGSSSAPAPAPNPPSVPVKPDPTPDPTPVPTPDATPEPPKPTFETYSLQVRFGDVERGELETRNVKRLTGLPGSNPVVLYLGVTGGGESAVFLVDSEVDVVGDGRCDPSPDDCETLVLEPGETVFLNRGETQFELDLIEIRANKTSDVDAVRKSRSAVAKGGPGALRRMKNASRYRYSESTGTVRELAPADRRQRASSSQFTSAG